MRAIVSVSYMCSGASMAGQGNEYTPQVEVFEIEATSEREALEIAYKKMENNPMAGRIHAKFIKWLN